MILPRSLICLFTQQQVTSPQRAQEWVIRSEGLTEEDPDYCSRHGRARPPCLQTAAPPHPARADGAELTAFCCRTLGGGGAGPGRQQGAGLTYINVLIVLSYRLLTSSSPIGWPRDSWGDTRFQLAQGQ